LDALSEGESARVVMFRMIPGKSLHVQKKSLAMKPTAGYDSHSSANFLEWCGSLLTALICPSRLADGVRLEQVCV
jgi:hypothetical protein